MITIRFPDLAAKRRALGFLADRFSFASWATGELAVPDEALGALTQEAIPFQIENSAEIDPQWDELLAEYERGETVELADAFAQMAGADRKTWDKRVADYEAKRPSSGE